MSQGPSTSRRIADAARVLFARQGVRATSVDQIAAAAGCSRMTVYRHYPGKRTLLRAALLLEFVRGTEAFDAAWNGPAALEDRVVHAFAWLVETVRGDALVERLLQTEPETILLALTIDGEETLSFAAGVVADHLRQEPELAVDADLLGEMLCRLVASVILQPYGRLRFATRQEIEDFAREWIVPFTRAAATPT